MPKITVDFNRSVAPIKQMNAVNNGPAARGRSQYRDNFEDYRALHIPYARTHDASICYEYGLEHTVDVDLIFTDFDADVNDPANYDFLLTDQYLKTMLDAGTEPYYRLGSKIEHWDKKYNTLPPKDFKKWAEICEHIIMHYNEGWADGFHWNIQYWEIWNEPETLEGQDPITKNCWGGTKEEFFDFFTIAAKHLKGRFPQLKIGGPALCWEHNWGRDFVRHLSEHQVPLDFYSWHIYVYKLYKFREDAEMVRGYLDEFGFTETESHINEWNYVKDWCEGFVDTLIDINNHVGAAFVSAAMMTCQHLPVDMLMYYDARVNSAFNGLFNILTFRVQHAYYSMLYFSKLAQLGTEVQSASDDAEICTLAAANKTGSAGMIAYYTDREQPETKTVQLELSGKTENFRFYRTSKASMYEEINVTVENGRATLTLEPFTTVFYTDCNDN